MNSILLFYLHFYFTAFLATFFCQTILFAAIDLKYDAF